MLFSMTFILQIESVQDKSVKEAIAEAKQREEADVSRILAEENINFVSEEDRVALTEIDGLTGRPLPTDVLHFAVPGVSSLRL
jgi:hypothetical protein